MSKDQSTITLPLGPRGGNKSMSVQEAIALLWDRIRALEAERNQLLAGYPGYE